MTTDNVLIRVENLQKSFGNLDVLSGIDINICKGEVVVVVGPSGSGKSTFLRCLNRLEESTGGSIYFNGEDITAPKVNSGKKIPPVMPFVLAHSVNVDRTTRIRSSIRSVCRSSNK